MKLKVNLLFKLKYEGFNNRTVMIAVILQYTQELVLKKTIQRYVSKKILLTKERKT